MAYNVKYTGAPKVGTVLAADLERDCFVRSESEPEHIYVGNVVVDPNTLDQLCCVGRGRVGANGCQFGCNHAHLEAESYWRSDNPLHGSMCFVSCYWF